MKIKALHRVIAIDDRPCDWEDCYILQFLQKASGGFNVIFTDMRGHLKCSNDLSDFRIEV